MKKLLGRLTEAEEQLLKQHDTAYYKWCRIVLTLSVGALTLSVSLQNNYIGPNTSYLILLKIAWFLFLLSTLFGLLALFGEAQTPLDVLNHLLEKKHSKEDHLSMIGKSQGGLYKRRRIFQHSGQIMTGCFLSALVLMAVFAGLNLP